MPFAIKIAIVLFLNGNQLLQNISIKCILLAEKSYFKIWKGNKMNKHNFDCWVILYIHVFYIRTKNIRT